MENKLFKEKYPKLYDENARRYRLAPVYDGADCGSVYSEWIRSKEELEKLSKIISNDARLCAIKVDCKAGIFAKKGEYLAWRG